MKHKWLAILVILLFLALLAYVLFMGKKATAAEPEGEESDDEGTIPPDGAPVNGDPRANRVAKVDTRFETRVEYHRAVFNALRARNIPVIAAYMMTAHSSKAQRGWKSPNPGKLWNFNCFGIKANPTYQKSKPFFVAGGREYSETTGYYPVTASWRSYNTVQESVDDYIALMRSSRYYVAWMFAVSTNEITLSAMTQWARLLRSCGYFTAPADAWGQSVYNIYHNIVRTDLGGP